MKERTKSLDKLRKIEQKMCIKHKRKTFTKKSKMRQSEEEKKVQKNNNKK